MEKSELLQHCEDLIAAASCCVPTVQQDGGSFKPEPILANVVCSTVAYMRMMLEGYEQKEPEEAIALIIRLGVRLTAEGIVPNSKF